MTSKSQSIVEQCFKMREKSFLESLDNVLLSITRDQISQQMLQHETSEKYIANRVEEIFKKVVSDARESYIDTLIAKIDTYEQIIKNNELEISKILGEDFVLKAKSQSKGQSPNYIRLLLSQIDDLKIKMLKQSNEQKAKIPNYYNVTDPASPAYNHLMGKVDLSELYDEIKNIQSDSEIVKNSLINLKRKSSKIIALMSTKTHAAMSLYADKIRKLSETNKRLQEELDKTHEATTNEVSVIKIQLNERVNDIAQLRKSLQEKETDVSSLTNSLNKAERDLEEIKTSFASLQEESFTKQSDMNKYKERLDIVGKENEKLRNDLNRFISENNESEKRTQQHEREYNRIVIELDDQAQKNEQLTARLEKRKEQIQIMKQKIIELTQEIEVSQRRWKEEHINYQSLSSKNQSLMDKISELTTKVEEHEITIDDIQLSSEQSKVQIQSELINAKQKINSLEKSLSEQIQKNEEQQEQIETLSHESFVNSKENSKIMNKEKEQKQKIEDQQHEIESLKSNYDDATRRLNSANETISAMKVKLVAQQRKIDESDDFLSEKDSKIENLKVVLEKQKEYTDQQTGKLNKATNDIILLTQQKRELENEIGVIKSQMQRSIIKQEELERVAENHASMKDKVKDQKDKVAQDLNAILSASMSRSVTGTIELIKQGSKAIETLRSLRIVLSITGKEVDLVERVRNIIDMNRKLVSAAGTSNTEDIVRMKEEYEQVSTLLSVKENVPKAVEKLYSVIKDASEFTCGIITKLTNSPVVIRSSLFPISQQRKEQLTRIINEIKDISNVNKNIVSSVIKEARKFGYKDDNGLEALKVIIRSKQTISTPSKDKEAQNEVNALRESLSKAVANHKKDSEAKIKEIADQRKVIVELTQKNINEKSSLTQRNIELERLVKKLNADLANERCLRTAFNDIANGKPSDRSLLSSKLTFQELKIVDMISEIARTSSKSK